MRALPINKPLKLMAFAALAMLVASCSTSRAPTQKSSTAVRSAPGLDINRAHKDGAPWWDVDVNKIPDATPTVHTGNYKANPYTVLGKTYYPMQESRNYRAEGTASWYGTKFHGQNTANGELYDLYGMSAAHKTLPLPAYVRVTNLANGRSVQVLPTVDAQSHTVQVRVELPTSVVGVAPGMFARLWLDAGKGTTSPTAAAVGPLLVPASVVVRRAEMTGVYVLDGQGRPLLRQVRLGRPAGDMVEVLSGVRAGDRIALQPQAAAKVR